MLKQLGSAAFDYYAISMATEPPLDPEELTTMPKGQQKSNKEPKKPKKEKTPPAAATSLTKGVVATNDSSKKKG